MLPQHEEFIKDLNKVLAKHNAVLEGNGDSVTVLFGGSTSPISCLMEATALYLFGPRT